MASPAAASPPSASRLSSGKPSETALRVAINSVTSGNNPAWRSLLPPEPYSEACIRAHSRHGRRMLASWRVPLVKQLLFSAREKFFPGGSLWILLRKRAVRDAVRDALRSGLRQLVVAGSGLDPLSTQLCQEFPELEAWEMDSPPTMQVKIAGLTASGGLSERLHLLPTDLSTLPFSTALAAAPGLDLTQPVVLVAEAVLMYLEHEAVARFLTDARTTLAVGSRIIISVVDNAPLDDPRHPVSRSMRILESLGEPVHWSMRRADLDTLLTRYGWTPREVLGPEELRQRYVLPLGLQDPVLEGELLAIGELR